MIDVRSAGAKGLGVFAKKLIPRGTRIISERALLTVHNYDASTLYPDIKRLSSKDRDVLMALSSFRDREIDLIRWSQVLVHTAQNTVSSLASAAMMMMKGKSSSFALPHNNNNNRRNSLSDHVEALGIFRSNSFDIGPLMGQRLFPKAARINHSCLPNAQGNFNVPLDSFTVHALRDIEQDEEVSLNYILETGALRHVRMEKLRGMFGFECGCPACDLSTEKGMEGEQKRAALIEILREFSERPVAGDITDLQAELEAMLAYVDLYESEGISGKELSNLYYKVTDLHYDMQNLDDALMYASFRVILDRDTLGEDNPAYKGSVELVEALEDLMENIRKSRLKGN